MSKKRIRFFSLGALAILLTAEAAPRLMGLLDFPVYVADSEIGYQIAPNQSGSFMNKNDWSFNDKSMGVQQIFAPKNDKDVLLIGDSIVLGGNPLPQEQKLGPRLTRKTGFMHWPIAAGSWSIRNELIYLSRHPEVVKAVSRIDFVVNSADFEQASSWACELTHPRKHPNFALLYLTEKYLIKPDVCGETPAELVVADGDWRKEVLKFANSQEMRGKQITFWLYPNKQEANDVALLESRLEVRGEELGKLLQGHDVRIFSLARDPRWRGVNYVDVIHPGALGIDVMADIMADARR